MDFYVKSKWVRVSFMCMSEIGYLYRLYIVTNVKDVNKTNSNI